MAGTAKTDLAAVAFTAPDLAAAPVGYDLESMRAVAQNKILDAKIAVQKLLDYATSAQTVTDLGTVLTSLS